jgi:hypothetical protein
MSDDDYYDYLDSQELNDMALEEAKEAEHRALCRIAELELEVKRLQSIVNMLTGA